MLFDTLMMAAVARELRGRIQHGKIEKIIQPSADKLAIRIYTAKAKLWLMVSIDAQTTHVCLTGRAQASSQTPPNFCMLARKHLDGGAILRVDSPFGAGERVLRIQVGRGELGVCHLNIELMGKHSNVILTDDHGLILGALKVVGAKMSSLRQVAPGLRYAPPPRLHSKEHDAFDGVPWPPTPAIELATPGDAQKWLMETYSGLSPLMAAEAVARVKTKPLTASTVWYGMNELTSTALSGELEPVTIDANNSSMPCAYPVRLLTVDPARQQHSATFSIALDDAYAKVEIESVLTRTRGDIMNVLKRAFKTCQRELIDVEEGLLNADRATEYREDGDLILANFNLIPKDTDSVDLVDLFHPELDELRNIELDPLLSPTQNADRYYKKHQKATHSRERLLARRVVLIEREGLLKERLAEAQNAVEVADLEHLLSGLDIDSGGKPAASSTSDDADAIISRFAGHKIKRYVSVDGWEILVGETAEANDFLTTKLSAPNDIWLHARSMTSAHAVIRTGNRPAAVFPATLRMAAELVAKRSDAKHAGLVSVDYTLKKHVRKPRKSHAGTVTYSNEKTIDVTPQL